MKKQNNSTSVKSLSKDQLKDIVAGDMYLHNPPGDHDRSRERTNG